MLARMAGSFLYNGHLLVKRWPEMAAKIKNRLLREGKITKEMIESYVDAYAGIYGDDTDAYVEEIIADTYAGMNRTDYGTNKLRADVETEVGQWQKKSGSARAPPAKMSIAQDFKSRVAAWYKSGMPDGTSFVLGETGATLQGLGAIESDIYMNGEKISTILKEHPEMTIREIQRIPEILDDPVLILKSRKRANSQYGNSRLVMFGTVKAQDGRNIMCVLDLRPTENGLLLDDMQKVSSAYTKDNKPEDFVKGSFVLHADKKRTIPLLRGMGFQMPMSLLRSGSIGSISYEGKSVNLRGEKFSDVVSVETSTEAETRKFSASARQAAEQDSEQEYSYRYTNDESPMSDWGHAMFADDPDASVGYGRENRYRYKVNRAKLTDIGDLRQEIIEKLTEQYEEGTLRRQDCSKMRDQRAKTKIPLQAGEGFFIFARSSR